MTIEQRFVLKAIEDRNYIAFMYEKKSYEYVKALKFENNLLHTNKGKFEFVKMKKITILKERYTELDSIYLKTIQDIDKGNCKTQTAQEHIEEIKHEL